MSKNLSGPYKDESVNLIYNLLFCDNLGLYKENFRGVADYPWNILFDSKSDEKNLEKLINNPQVESRIKILTCNKLRETGSTIRVKELLGVIVEIGLDEGLDVLACFRDNSVRYINHTGKMLVWETRDITADTIIDELFFHSENVVAKIGPWYKPRLAPPVIGNARLTFLVSDELYFGEAPLNLFFSDSMAGPVLNTATSLLQYITDKSGST